MKQLMAYALLFSFAVLFAPREFFHACDHHKENDHSVPQSNDDSGCYVCDYDLSPAEQPVLFSFHIPEIVTCDLEQPLPEAPALDVNDDQLRRGPPSSIL
jgi:hypothetical protein